MGRSDASRGVVGRVLVTQCGICGASSTLFSTLFWSIGEEAAAASRLLLCTPSRHRHRRNVLELSWLGRARRFVEARAWLAASAPDSKPARPWDWLLGWLRGLRPSTPPGGGTTADQAVKSPPGSQAKQVAVDRLPLPQRRRRSNCSACVWVDSPQLVGSPRISPDPVVLPHAVL